MALSESIKQALEKERERLHKEHPLYEEKTKQRLHHVRDRKEMIDACLEAGDREERYAKVSALDSLRAERDGRLQDAELQRMMARHHDFYADRWFSLARRMQFPSHDVRERALSEEECAEAMDKFWFLAHRKKTLDVSDPDRVARIFKESMERAKAASEKHAEVAEDPVHGGSSGSPHT